MKRIRIIFTCALAVLLAGCGASRRTEETVREFRDHCIGAVYTATAELTVPRTDETLFYTVSVRSDGEETAVTVESPETIAGVTARLRGNDLALTYDGMALDAGTVGQRISAVNAVPLLLQTAASGLVTAREETTCDGVPAVSFLAEEEGKPLSCRVWLGQDGTLLAGELAEDGVTAIFLRFTAFTFGGTAVGADA